MPYLYSILGINGYNVTINISPVCQDRDTMVAYSRMFIYTIKGGVKIMSDLPNCPKCNSEYTYEDRHLFVCPECFHEWTLESETIEVEEKNVIRDANGNILQDGDSVIVIKDLKVKGSSSVIKLGTKVNDIKLIENPSDGHDIDCKIGGFGSMKLKSEFVRKG